MSLINLEKNIIWPTCIFTMYWRDHTVYAKDLQKNIEEWSEQEKESKVARHIKRNLYESEFNYLTQDVECVQKLQEFILQALTEVSKDMNGQIWTKNSKYGIEVTESWFHVTKNGGYHDVHGHPMNSWSGIYYLNIGESQIETKNGINRFYAPFKSDYIDRGNQYLTNIWDLSPKNGMLVLFPSYLLHSALPYFGKNPRHVIAFNARITDAS
jgi:uncharacterized protein (TIGR02466 family)